MDRVPFIVNDGGQELGHGGGWGSYRRWGN